MSYYSRRPSCSRLQPRPKPRFQPRPRGRLGPNTPYHRLEPTIPRRPTVPPTSVYSVILPCRYPVSCAYIGSSFLTVNGAWELHIESAERVYKGMEEGVKRRLIELTRQRVSGLAQLDWTLKKAGKSRRVVSSTFLLISLLKLR